MPYQQLKLPHNLTRTVCIYIYTHADTILRRRNTRSTVRSLKLVLNSAVNQDTPINYSCDNYRLTTGLISEKQFGILKYFYC